MERKRDGERAGERVRERERERERGREGEKGGEEEQGEKERERAVPSITCITFPKPPLPSTASNSKSSSDTCCQTIPHPTMRYEGDSNTTRNKIY